MLRDGQFLKEPPVKLGAYHVPAFGQRYQSSEERFMQSVLLKDLKPVSPWSLLLNRLLRL
jgi:hypothetical protein